MDHGQSEWTMGSQIGPWTVRLVHGVDTSCSRVLIVAQKAVNLAGFRVTIENPMSANYQQEELQQPQQQHVTTSG